MSAFKDSGASSNPWLALQLELWAIEIWEIEYYADLRVRVMTLCLIIYPNTVILFHVGVTYGATIAIISLLSLINPISPWIVARMSKSGALPDR